MQIAGGSIIEEAPTESCCGMKFELSSKLLKGILWGNIQGTIVALLKVDTRSLDYSLYGVLLGRV